MNELYLIIKPDVCNALVTDHPAGQGLIERSRHVRDRYITWGAANAQKCKAVRQLAVSERITEETKNAVAMAYEKLHDMMHELATGCVFKDRSAAFTSAILGALAETTMEFIAREPDQADRYREAGFEASWSAVAG